MTMTWPGPVAPLPNSNPSRAATGGGYIVLNGAASNGPRVMSVAIGPRVDTGASDAVANIDRTLLGSPSWRMSSAFFNLNEKRDTPNTEMFLQLYETGVTQSFEQTFNDFAVSATLKSLRRVDPPNCTQH